MSIIGALISLWVIGATFSVMLSAASYFFERGNISHR